MKNKTTPLKAGTVSALLATFSIPAALAAGVSSSATCDLSAGLPVSSTAAYEVATNCLLAPPQDVVLRDDLAADLEVLTNRLREKRGLSVLALRPAFVRTAMVHGLDISQTGHIGHEDAAGRGHLDRLRLLDRTALIGEAGGIVAVLPAAGTDAGEIYRALMSDPVNAANLLREGFSDQGVAVIEQDGRLIVVQVLARLEGELEAPLPLRLAGNADLSADIREAGWKNTGWRIESDAEQTLARGLNPRIDGDRRWNGVGGLIIEASDGRADYRLRGPIIED